MTHRLISTICFIGLGGMPHERAVFSAPEGAAATGGGSGGGGAPPASAPGAAPSAGSGAGSSTPNTTPQQTQQGGAPATPPPTTPQRDPWKVKHKHKLPGENGAEERELELELDLSEHLAGYKRKLKADGREHEVTVEQAFERWPLSEAAWTRMEEAKHLRTQAEQNIERVKQLDALIRTPEGAADVLRASLGEEKFMEMCFHIVTDRIAYEKMTPEQRTQHDARVKADAEARKRDRSHKSREQQLADRERALNEREAKGIRERLVREWPQYLEQAGVPANEASIGDMARVMQDARRLGYRISPQEAAAQVKKNLDTYLSSVLKGDPTKLRELLGEEGAQKLQQLEVQRLEQQPGRTISIPNNAEQPPARQTTQRRSREPQTLEELRDQRMTAGRR